MTQLATTPTTDASPAPRQSPPRAALTLRVGVVGHRPNRLDQADLPLLGQRLHEVLDLVGTMVRKFQHSHPGLYADTPAALRAVTSLAEGADRLFADQALALGYALCCPVPFHQAGYEQDFQPPKSHQAGSLEEFRGLLDGARQGAGLVLYELDGDRSGATGIYEAAASVLLHQSDLLVTVWDGGPSAGSGGTVATLGRALQDSIPVVWVDARAPHNWCLLREPSDLPPATEDNPADPPARGSDREGLNAAVREILDLPTPELSEQKGEEDLAAAHCERYFKERRPRWNFAVAWRMFRGLHGTGRLRLPSVRVQEFEKAAAYDWPNSEGVTGWVNAQLAPHYAWAGKLAGLYADAYRSTFLLGYTLAAVAVMLALLPMTVGAYVEIPWFETLCITAELVVILTILLMVRRARRRHWHQRWLDYRLLAEMIRQLRFLLPLGAPWPFPRAPAHWESYGDLSRRWMAWHMRALTRASGLPDATVDQAYLRQCLGYLKQVLEGQLKFHQENWKQSEQIEHSLHHASIGLIVATLVCILAHLTPFLHALGPVLTLCCATFPAFGAALAGINNQAEFARIARRSRAMTTQIEKALAAITELELAKSLSLAEVSGLARGAARLMVDEVLDWRVIFTDRPTSLPA